MLNEKKEIDKVVVERVCSFWRVKGLGEKRTWKLPAVVAEQ